MTPTNLLYLKNFTLLESPARVLDVRTEDTRIIVTLDQTVFYAQGGGQPYDQGRMTTKDAIFRVEEVRYLDGIVQHKGVFERGDFEVGTEITCHVDAERRLLNSRLHSGGHVVDMGVLALNLPWTPGKGYHFPDGPYVEYQGSLDGTDPVALKSNLEQKCNALIQEGRKTELRFMAKEDMYTVCHHVPDALPEGKPTRVVLYGDFGVPCGGTHVRNIAEIQKLTIRKIKSKGKGVVRVSYDVVH